jgi:hypothetical protein
MTKQRQDAVASKTESKSIKRELPTMLPSVAIVTSATIGRAVDLIAFHPTYRINSDQLAFFVTDLTIMKRLVRCAAATDNVLKASLNRLPHQTGTDPFRLTAP